MEFLLYYLYDETGLPIGLKYRTSAYEAGVFDCFFFEKNLQGDIIGVYNSTGKRIGTYTYDAWGNINYSLASGNTALETRIVFRLNPFRYRGYYYDVETGLYYLQSRYYNPEWGRFLNADGQLNTGFLGYNLFAYAWNNPIMFIDPSGTCSCPMYDPNCRDCRQRKLQAELAGLPFEERVPNYDKISHKYDEDDLTGESNKGLDYGGAELIVTIPISVYAAAIGLFVESTEATVAAVIGTGITIPINLTVHLSNPNLTTNQKCGLAVYDIATGVGGVLITYGMANCWNVTGVPMIIFGILYPVGTYAIGYIIEEKMIQQNTKAQIHW